MRQILVNSWDLVSKDYVNGLINSERCLQAALYRALRMEGRDDFCVFVEPRLLIPGSEHPCLPDIVLCSGNNIHAFIEIKYIPHGFPRFHDDLNKLNKFAALDNAVFDIAINPATGKYDNVQYAPHQDSLLIFAVIGQKNAKAVWKPDIEKSMELAAKVKKRFVLMFGQVNSDGDPPIFGCE